MWCGWQNLSLFLRTKAIVSRWVLASAALSHRGWDETLRLQSATGGDETFSLASREWRARQSVRLELNRRLPVQAYGLAALLVCLR